GVEVELLAQGEQPALRALLLWQAVPLGPAHGAEEDRVGPPAERQRLGRQWPVGGVDRGTADQRLLELERHPGSRADGAQHAHRLRCYLLPDAVAGQDRDR